MLQWAKMLTSGTHLAERTAEDRRRGRCLFGLGLVAINERRVSHLSEGDTYKSIEADALLVL